MKKYTFLLFLIFGLFAVNCFSQNKNIDSLTILIKNDKADTNKVKHLIVLSYQYIIIGLYDTGLHYSYKAIELAEKVNFKKGVSASYGNIGLFYKEQANYPKALDYYFKALSIDEELGNKQGIARHLGSIGTVYAIEEKLSKALEYYLKALDIAEKFGDKNGVASKLSNIGNNYLKLGDYPKALDNYFKAFKINEELRNKNGSATILKNIGTVFYCQGLWAKALEYFFKSLKMNEELGNKNGIALLHSNIGSVYSMTGHFKEAEQYLKKAATLEESIGMLYELMETESNLSHLYEITQQQKKALIHYKKSVTLKDTIFSQENRKQLVQKEMKYEFEKKEAITKAKNEKQHAIAEEKSRKQKLILFFVSCVLILVFVFAIFIFRSLRITRKQKQIIEIKNVETENQKKIIEEKNKDITDSIHYAKRIQNALLRDEEHTSLHLPEHFILFMPKDIVSGDFYWGAERQGQWYFAAVDCTGHGVPGAVMSMLGISFLNDIVASEQLLTPGEVLNRLRDKVIKELRQTGEAGGSKDGMDISLARLNLTTKCLQWAGANNPLNLIRNGKLEEVKADKQPIGYHPENHPFTNHEIQLKKGDSIYIYSDGYADQFGGPKGKKFKYKQLEDLIIANNQLAMNDQKEILKKRFIQWKGSLEQIDDVCVFCVRI